LLKRAVWRGKFRALAEWSVLAELKKLRREWSPEYIWPVRCSLQTLERRVRLRGVVNLRIDTAEKLRSFVW
jgi:hypothetical protein